jgi:hypothetical protein
MPWKGNASFDCGRLDANGFEKALAASLADERKQAGHSSVVY